jgi:hypothetical protein
MKSTGLKRDTIDKFYTKPLIAQKCSELFKKNIYVIPELDIIIEPSAGNGSFIPFLKPLCDTCLFYDIEPEAALIIKQDYLEFNHNSLPLPDILTKIHVVGNPPFGRQSSLAIKFIKKSAEFCDTISFILPSSFKKISMQKYFPSTFHLIYQCDIEKNAFTIDEKDINVPCVFQIWEKRNETRIKPTKLNPTLFDFVKREENPDISFRRVGVNAGKIDTELLQEKSVQSHYFIKFNETVDKANIISKMKYIQYETNNTVGPRSISKQELIQEFNKII